MGLTQWRWHIFSIPLGTGPGLSAKTCGLDDVFPPDDLGCGPETYLMAKFIFHIMDVCLKWDLFKGYVYTGSWYYQSGVSTTTIVLSFSEWFRLFDVGFFII